MAQLPPVIFPHSKKVCMLYKKALRTLDSWYGAKRLEFRWHAVHLRDRFDKNANIKDLRIAKELLEAGEREWIGKRHAEPKQFPYSPGGTAYERYPVYPDALIDVWHPMEKAFYPKYFARRESRKKDYVEWYNKVYPQDQIELKDKH